jgi:hypothetical protein
VQRLATLPPPKFHRAGKQTAALRAISSFPLENDQKKEPTMAAKAIPDGYHAVTPYLIASDAAKTIEFAKKAFGAEYAFG